MAISKPTVGQTGWNIAVDAVIDKVNELDGATALTPLAFGGTGNGTADDTDALAALFASGVDHVHIPDGVWTTTDPIDLPHTMSVTADPDATIKATAEMGAVLSTDPANIAERQGIYGLTIDCNRLADTGIDLGYFRHYTLDSVRVLRALGDWIILGDLSTSAFSYEAMLHNVQTWVDAGVPTTPGARGIYVRKATDCEVSQAIVVGADIGVRLDTGCGGSKFIQVHVYGRFGSSPSVCFDDTAGGTQYIACSADTPTTYGWHLRNFSTRIIGGGVFLNNTVVDNTVVGVFLEPTSTSHTFLGMFFNGADSSHRMAADFQGGVMSGVYTVGHQYSQVVSRYSLPTTPVTVGAPTLAEASQLLVRAAAGQSRDLFFQSGTLNRWRVRTNNAGETGSNAGSDLGITAYDDAGAFLRDVLTLNRRFGYLLLAEGSNLQFGTTTGTQIGTGATQKLGFYGATAVVRPTSTPAAAIDPTTTQALVNDLRTKLIALGLIS